MQKLCVFFILLIVYGCSCGDENKPAPSPQEPLKQSKNSELFNASFNKLLNNYYNLQAAFVKEDSVLINNSISSLIASADSLALKEIKSDSTIIETAKSYSTSISDDAKAMLAEKDINEKRKGFEMISNYIIDLIRTVQFDRAKVYKIHCPMAFDNKGADWLSKDTNVLNPYLPTEMLECGEIVDTINYIK